MAIIKKPTLSSTEVDQFISGAPDAPDKKHNRIRKGRKVQITLTLPEPLLDRIDALSNQLGQSRAAIINLSIIQTLESGLRINYMSHSIVN